MTPSAQSAARGGSGTESNSGKRKRGYSFLNLTSAALCGRQISLLMKQRVKKHKLMI
jgi:hypothetical protein